MRFHLQNSSRSLSRIYKTISTSELQGFLRNYMKFYLYVTIKLRMTKLGAFNVKCTLFAFAFLYETFTASTDEMKSIPNKNALDLR